MKFTKNILRIPTYDMNSSFWIIDPDTKGVYIDYTETLLVEHLYLLSYRKILSYMFCKTALASQTAENMKNII